MSCHCQSYQPFPNSLNRRTGGRAKHPPWTSVDTETTILDHGLSTVEELRVIHFK